MNGHTEESDGIEIDVASVIEELSTQLSYTIRELAVEKAKVRALLEQRRGRELRGM